MTEPAAPRSASLLDRTALFLAALGLILRVAVGGAVAGTGLNLLIHLLFWLALAVAFLAHTLRGGGTWLLTGIEFPLLAFSIAVLASTRSASHLLPALERAFGFLSLALLLVGAIQSFRKADMVAAFLALLPLLALYAFAQYFFYFPRLLDDYDPGTLGPLTRDLEARVRGREIFATFLGPNQFAGFLALTIPLAAGAALDVRRAGPRAWTPWAAGAALGIAALAQTGSRGAWVSLAAGGAAFAGLALTRRRGRAALVTGAGAAGVLLLALTIFGPLLEKLASASASMHCRRVYWEAAVRTAARAPILGVGLDNYEDCFTQLKSDVQQESTKVHNDYLQLLAETGAAGLLSFLALVGFVLSRALRREAIPAPDPPETGTWIWPAAGAAGFLLAWLSGGPLPPEAALLLAAAWPWAWRLAAPSRRAWSAGDAAWTRLGAAAGLLAFLLHMTVEFDLYEWGTAAAFFLALGLNLLLAGRAAPLNLPRGAAAAAAVLTLLVALPLLVAAAPRALAADRELEAARRALLRGDAPEAVRHAQAAERHNPAASEAYALHAEGRFALWKTLREHPSSRTDPALVQELSEHEEIALEALTSALRLRPRSSPLHDRKASLHRAFGAFAEGRSGALARARAAEHARLAREHARRAVELYPTAARPRYALARLLDEQGFAEEARREYAEALRLSERAAAEPFPQEHLRLSPDQEAECRRKARAP
ncbi:MAG TPA: O-antigen ligase family protein [Planctomycetota bacterium]|jgi:tetratricopeptide (TPR) repeat protein|nr:O-antigen ligase family protein [Planctomycetota bacterium]